jgi:hypothetical protein
MPPERVVAVVCVDWPDVVVEVEVSYDAIGTPIPIGVRVRRALPMKPTTRHGTDPTWPEGTQPAPISTRELKRLPLERIVNAVIVMLVQVTKEPAPDRMDPVAEMLNPAFRPTRRNKAVFYEGVGNYARYCAARGLSPAKELARAKNVKENTAHQWLYKARQLGFLERSRRSRQLA